MSQPQKFSENGNPALSPAAPQAYAIQLCDVPVLRTALHCDEPLAATSAFTVRMSRLSQFAADVICYVVLCSEWPLIASHDGQPDRLFPRFQNHFCGSDTLSLFPVHHLSELWAALNSKSDAESAAPCGLIVDLSYEEERFFRPEHAAQLALLSQLGQVNLTRWWSSHDTRIVNYPALIHGESH